MSRVINNTSSSSNLNLNQLHEVLDDEDELDYYNEATLASRRLKAALLNGDILSKKSLTARSLYSNETRNTTSAFLDPNSVPIVLRKNSSYERHILNQNERRVLVIYTGGTIGMVRSPRGGLIPVPHMLERTVRKYPHLHDEIYGRVRFGDIGKAGETPLVLPELPGENHRITYTIYEYDPLLDSSNMTMDDWIHIAEDIRDNYNSFDGFVVLHGTDTMSYTASALSFMMENLGKPVVVTGSQIPLFESRSDGRDNFLGALILAGTYNIPEVTCYFGNKLFRGNRVTKVSSDSLNAFDSPNMSPLATVGINIQVDFGNIFRSKQLAPFSLNTNLDRNVGVLRLFPSITAETVRVFLQAPTKGVVLQTYGAGNVPSNRPDLLKELEDASKRGVLIVNCTQCGHGSVSAIYETGQLTEAAGVIPGYDMTTETAVTKIMYAIGRTDWDIEKKREMIQTNLRGELTKISKPHHSFDSSNKNQGYVSPNANELLDEIVDELDIVQNIVQIVSSSLGLTSSEELSSIRNALAPSLNHALMSLNTQSQSSNYLQNFNKRFGSSEITSDDSGRTPVRFASNFSNIQKSEYLLGKGASIHMAAKKVGVLGLQSFLQAGANMNQMDACRLTPLHVASEAESISDLELLLSSSGASKTEMTSHTPLDLNQLCNLVEITQLLQSFSGSSHSPTNINVNINLNVTQN